MRTFTALIVTLTLFGCAASPKTAEKAQDLEYEAQRTMARFMDTDPSMSTKFFDTAKGVAVFPSIGKGGAGIGGAFGRGVLFEGGKAVGYCTVSQGSIGFQLGGQAFSQIIFFLTREAVDNFKQGNMEFAANASAVAAAADASAAADYENDVATFTLAGKGLMYEASIGGQKFKYEPKP